MVVCFLYGSAQQVAVEVTFQTYYTVSRTDTYDDCVSSLQMHDSVYCRSGVCGGVIKYTLSDMSSIISISPTVPKQRETNSINILSESGGEDG